MDTEEITVAEAANLLKVTRGRIGALLSKGQLSHRFVGPIRLIPLDDVKNYKKNRKGAGRPKIA